jgi:hypothetical protein
LSLEADAKNCSISFSFFLFLFLSSSSKIMRGSRGLYGPRGSKRGSSPTYPSARFTFIFQDILRTPLLCCTGTHAWLACRPPGEDPAVYLTIRVWPDIR